MKSLICQVPERRRFIAALATTTAAGAAAALLPVRAGAAADVIRLVLPLPAGNSVDATARALAQGMERQAGRSMIVDNKPGAAGMVGSAEVARSRPDGSVLMINTGGLLTNAVMYKKLPYDVMKDFTPITQLSESSGFMLLVGPNSPYKTLADYLAAARAKPGTISYGSNGVGNTTHLMGELLGRSANVQLLHVPYKGSPDTDVAAGITDSMFIGTSSAVPWIQSGRMRALAVSGSKRSKVLRDVPTFEELGFKNVDLPAYSAIWGPAGMKPDLALSLRNEIEKASADPAFQRQMELSTGTFVGSTPEEFKRFLDAQYIELKRLLPPLGIALE